MGWGTEGAMPRATFYGLCTVVAGAIFAFDLAMPLGVAGGVPYVALVLMALLSPRPGDALFLGSLGWALTLLGYLLSDPLGIPWMVAVNRGLALLAVGVTCLAIWQRQKAMIALSGAHDTLEARVEERTRDLEAAKEAAELANRSKTDFLANMSHELRTPLNAIIGYSDVLVQQVYGPMNPGKYQEYAGDINTSGRHLLNLINEILDISRIESGHMELNELDSDVGEIVGAAVKMSENRALRQKVVLETDIQAVQATLRCDALRIKQVLINLLSNAIKFSDPGNNVQLRVFVDGEAGLVLQVEDHGIGVDPKDLERIFLPFEQGEVGLSRKHQGVGLGLPLSRRLTELNGGRLDLVSEVGKGTIVTLRFPSDRVGCGNGQEEVPLQPMGSSARRSGPS